MAINRFESICKKIESNKDVTWEEMWNTINARMFNLFTDGEITREESEQILDKVEQLNYTQLIKHFKDIYNRSLK